MKQLLLVTASLCLFVSAMAQTDTTAQKADSTVRRDTITIGNRVIISITKKPGRNSKDSTTSTNISYNRGKLPKKKSNVSTNWFILDLGFNNYSDKTDYASPAAQQFAPGGNKDWFRLRNGKSINVNFWFFMQRMNMVKHVVNLKYGLGLELNNYRYKDDVVFSTNPTRVALSPTINFSKNKLAADYLTVPLMLEFDFTPGRSKSSSFGLAAGVSGGYLYSSRQKLKSSEEGQNKNRDDFDLNPFKLSYVGELTLGPVKLYGSMATKSMFENGLDQTPYNLGIRLSRW